MRKLIYKILRWMLLEKIIIDKQNIIENFGGKIHNISFNIDNMEFSSTREGDFQIISIFKISIFNIK